MTTDKGRAVHRLTKRWLGRIINASDGAVVGVEVKVERTSRHGNFFLRRHGAILPRTSKAGMAGHALV